MLESDDILDVCGLDCPMPLLKMKQRLNKMSAGGVLTVITTDKASVRDFSVFLRQAGHALLEQREDNAQYQFRIKKGQ